MGAGHLGHAQLFPQCINIDIQSDQSSLQPCMNGADCRKGDQLYREETNPGLFVSIHSAITDYRIPGPAIWHGLAK
jgi:hypothetical protein